MPASELEQWCEIDGHEWQEVFLEYGLVLGPKTVEWTQTCLKCRLTRTLFVFPVGKPPTLPRKVVI